MATPTTPSQPPAASGGRAEALQSIGGLVAVALGVVAVVVIGLAALFLVSYTKTKSEVVASIATAAFGVVSAVVGAYFGIKLGTDQTSNLVRANQATQAKADVYALHVPNEKGSDVAALALQAAQQATDALRRR